MGEEYRHSRSAAAALGCLLLLGAGVRLFELGRESISHPETYVPGIDLPADLVEPALPRHTLWKVVDGCVRAETHPPLYYAMMLAWTKVFGTHVLALRLPSVLFGVASIVLIYLLGTREGGRPVGFLAAGMLALNGHHVLWSRTAQGYSLACFLGLLSTLSLLRLTRHAPRPLATLALYGLSTLAGLGTEVFFWPILATQILWVARHSASPAATPQLLRWQFLIVLLASPLCAVAAHQTHMPSHAVGNGVTFLGEFLQFGFLFEPGFKPPLGLLATGAAFGLALVAVGLLAVGLASTGSAGDEVPALPGPPAWLTTTAGSLALGAILLFAGYSYAVNGPRTLLIAASGLVPLGVSALDLLSRRGRGSWPAFLGTGAARWVDRVSLVALLAVGPIAMILLVSLAVPLYASRGVLLYTPYLIVTTALGLVVLTSRDLRWLALGLALVAAHLGSVGYFLQGPADPLDYKGLAERLAPRVKDSDLVFVKGRFWATSPLFYYLDAGRYRVVGENYSEGIAGRPHGRVWVVAWRDDSLPAGLTNALHGYEPGERVEARGGQAVLYEKKLKTAYGAAP